PRAGVYGDARANLLEDRIPGLAPAAIRRLAHRLDACRGRRGRGRAGRRQSGTRLPLGLRRGPSEYRDGVRRDPHADRSRRHSLSRRDPGGAARAPLPAAARAQRGVVPNPLTAARLSSSAKADDPVIAGPDEDTASALRAAT